MMIKPAPKKIPYTFFAPSFHYQQFPDVDLLEMDEIEGSASLNWRDRLTIFVHPREEEEVDHIFKWRYNHERSVMSPELMSQLRSMHVFRDAPIDARLSGCSDLVQEREESFKVNLEIEISTFLQLVFLL